MTTQTQPHTQASSRPGYWQLIASFWISDQRWRALPLLAVTFGVIFAGIYLQVWANSLLGDVTDALVQRKWSVLRPILLMSVVVGIMSGISILARQALEGMLELSWRTWLTERFLREWTKSHVFYDIEREGVISNADQRIAEDVRQFVKQTLSLGLNLIGVVASAVTFTLLLWELSGTLEFAIASAHFSIPGYMVYLAYASAIGSFVLAHWVGKALVSLNIRRQTVEADFRYGAMQVRENAEQIAFYGGGARESQRLMQRFEDIRDNLVAIIIRSVKVAFTTNTYVHIFAPLPTLAALPMYLAGEITLGGVTRVTGAFGALSVNLAFFTNSYAELSTWFALADRLRDLEASINKAQNRVSGFVVERAPQEEVTTGPLLLRKPGGEVLAEVPPLHFAPGQRWLVRGPSGTGKSTLLRAVAGLWPHGKGAIRLPAGANLMFLPQRSYIPSGSLKAAICYPGSRTQFDDAMCERALRKCGMAQYAERLHDVDTWQQKLSGGEQQRLAFARVLLHRPDFIFLDEATSALDPETERMLYQTLMNQLPDSAVISVAHRVSLAQFHDNALDLKPGGHAVVLEEELMEA
jgi:putative ATP-binding cassette transporter